VKIVLVIPEFDLLISFSVEDVFQKLLALLSDWSVGPDGLYGEFFFDF
jgi:hypothetical protein